MKIMEVLMGVEPTPSEAEKQIYQALSSIRFGTLQITIHDSRIVQIEKSEKVRFDPKGRLISESLS
jgi:hypothetical protein